MYIEPVCMGSDSASLASDIKQEIDDNNNTKLKPVLRKLSHRQKLSDCHPLLAATCRPKQACNNYKLNLTTCEVASENGGLRQRFLTSLIGPFRLVRCHVILTQTDSGSPSASSAPPWLRFRPDAHPTLIVRSPYQPAMTPYLHDALAIVSTPPEHP